MVPGDGETGAVLVGHPDIDQVTFTGSVPTGIRVAQAAAANVVPSVTELRGGMVGFSWDRIPHAGEVNGLYCSMGYRGHGVQMATYRGCAVAEMMDGNPGADPIRGFGFPEVPVPFYNGTAWFLPFGGAYYKAKDKLF